jgi:subtilisin family serine protease
MGYGVNVYSSTERRCNNQAFYERMSGTSMAAPYVAGIAALYRCRSPDLTALEVRDLILDNAVKLPKTPAGRGGRGLAVYR